MRSSPVWHKTVSQDQLASGSVLSRSNDVARAGIPTPCCRQGFKRREQISLQHDRPGRRVMGSGGILEGGRACRTRPFARVGAPAREPWEPARKRKYLREKHLAPGPRDSHGSRAVAPCCAPGCTHTPLPAVTPWVRTTLSGQPGFEGGAPSNR